MAFVTILVSINFYHIFFILNTNNNFCENQEVFGWFEKYTLLNSHMNSLNFNVEKLKIDRQLRKCALEDGGWYSSGKKKEYWRKWNNKKWEEWIIRNQCLLK